MPGMELRGDSANQRGAMLNSILGVGAESVTALTEVLLLPSLVLAFFVAELTPSYVTIGLVPAVAVSLWSLARVPAMVLLANQRRAQPWAFGAALVRAAAIALLAIVASRTDPAGLAQSGRPLLLTVFLCLIVYTLAAGFGSVSTAAMLRSSVPADSWQRFVRQRSFWSLLLCLIGAFIVARLLGSAALAFPGNFGRLFLVATICLIAVAVFLVAMREAPSAVTSPPSLSPAQLRLPLIDSRYRRFLLFRALFSASAAIDPFIFLYAVTRLGTPVTAIGNYAIAGVLGWIVSAPVWVWLEHRSGPRAVLQSATVLRLVAPAMALVMPHLSGASPVRDRIAESTMATDLFPLAFAAIGAALAAQSRGNSGYLSALAPRHLQAAYAGLTNSVLVVIAFSPMVGGAIIERFGYEALFGTAIVLGLAAVFAGGFLSFVAAQPRTPTGINLDRGQPGRTLAIG